MSEVSPRQNVSFASNGGQVHGYLAKPDGGSGPGVILIQEWWGLDDHIADVADRLTGDGFVVLVPDLFGGRVAHDADSAAQMLADLPVEQAAKDLFGALDFLLAAPDVTSTKVGAIGFGMGGGFVLQLAAQQPDRLFAAVPFYGVGPGVPDQYRTVDAPVQGHYGERDETYPVKQARAQEKLIRDESQSSVEFCYYPAGHAFHNEKNQQGTYDPQSAELAWSRAVEFLKAHAA
ncbi:MAG: dienelactone hydrolase family protein [Actinomycetota bacterium]